jgi:hypothetical protein
VSANLRRACDVCGWWYRWPVNLGACPSCERWAARCMRYLMAKALGVEVHR